MLEQDDAHPSSITQKSTSKMNERKHTACAKEVGMHSEHTIQPRRKQKQQRQLCTLVRIIQNWTNDVFGDRKYDKSPPKRNSIFCDQADSVSYVYNGILQKNRTKARNDSLQFLICPFLIRGDLLYVALQSCMIEEKVGVSIDQLALQRITQTGLAFI